jgi:hypothetical protein
MKKKIDYSKEKMTAWEKVVTMRGEAEKREERSEYTAECQNCCDTGILLDYARQEINLCKC